MNILASKNQRKKYGQRLKNMREQHGLTLESLAKEIGTTKQTLSNIENAKYKSINPTILHNLSKRFACSADYLCGKTKTQKHIEIDGKVYVYPISINGQDQIINRLRELCGRNITLLDLIADYLEIAPVEQRNVFESFMKSFIKLAKSQQEKSED